MQNPWFMTSSPGRLYNLLVYSVVDFHYHSTIWTRGGTASNRVRGERSATGGGAPHNRARNSLERDVLHLSWGTDTLARIVGSGKWQQRSRISKFVCHGSSYRNVLSDHRMHTIKLESKRRHLDRRYCKWGDRINRKKNNNSLKHLILHRV